MLTGNNGKEGKGLVPFDEREGAKSLILDLL